MSNPLCIYHGNCADGFAAAWVVRKYFGDGNVDFFPGVYQNPPPDVTDREVYLVDFSYKRDVILEMAKVAGSIHIIDHHKSAVEDLVDLPDNVICIFDMEKSGATLTWETFFGIDCPLPLQYIADRDLWKFALPCSREFNAAIFSYSYDFRVWDQLMKEEGIDHLIAEGTAIERKHHKDVRELLKVTHRLMTIAGYTVPVANLPYTLTSDAGNLMAKGQPFAACYWDTPEGRVFSLRSNDDGMDVSEIAKLFGGGGHRNAAGFRVSFEEARKFEIA